MAKKNLINIFFKILVIAAIAYAFILIALIKIKIAVVISLIFFLMTIILIFFSKIDEKKFFLVFFFIYPLLPGLWGVNLPFGLPVLRAHRIATVIMIIYLIRNGLFIKYYMNFFRTRLFNLPIFFIILSLFTSSILSSVVVSSIFFTISFIFELILLGIVVYNAFTEREEIESLVKILCYSAIILSFICIYEKFSGFNIYTILGTYQDPDTLLTLMRDETIRVRGPFIHPISCGIYFAMIFPLVLYKYRDVYGKFYLSLGLISIILLATQSRGAQIGAFIAITLYIIFIERKKIMILLFASIPLIIIYFEKIYMYLRELNPFTVTDEALVASTMDRYIQFDFYIQYIKERLLFGYGLESQQPLLRDLLDGRMGMYSDSIDNFYLGYSLRFGIVGLTTWLYLMIEVIRKPLKLFGKGIFQDKLILSLLSSFIIFDITNIIVFLWHYHFVFWIFLGVLTRLMVIKNNELINIKKQEKVTN
ncbi:MAG: hypothetical protein A2V66_07035 [Ignavibacteria bacterium RBG_13_36_8]|nr:MAG: hypothetical protein A2V66_07035 [Ignavibacteria bacterium RBG_13_36_8]